MNKYLLIFLFAVLTLVGEYRPQRDADGNLLSRQCWGSTGTCWCAYDKRIQPFRLSDGVNCPDNKLPSRPPVPASYIANEIREPKK